MPLLSSGVVRCMTTWYVVQASDAHLDAVRLRDMLAATTAELAELRAIHHAASSQHAELERDARELEAALAHARTELQLAAATKAELEAQLTAGREKSHANLQARVCVSRSRVRACACVRSRVLLCVPASQWRMCRSRWKRGASCKRQSSRWVVCACAA